MIVKCFFNSLVASVCSKTLVGKENLTLTVIYFQNLDFHGVTNLGNRGKIHAGVVGVFVLGKNTVRFVSDVQNDLFRFHIDDCTFDYLSCMYCL